MAEIMTYHSPRLVIVGTGRSGTSTVARVAHERLGICMGHYLRSPGPANPEGFYEDLLAHGIMQLILEDAISTDEFIRCVSQSHKDCKQWGFKDPWFFYLPMGAMKMIDPQLVIRTWRPLKATVSSWLRKEILVGRTVSEKDAEEFEKLCLEREQMMDEKLGLFNVLTIRFDREVGDDEIEDAIRGHL